MLFSQGSVMTFIRRGG